MTCSAISEVLMSMSWFLHNHRDTIFNMSNFISVISYVNIFTLLRVSVGEHDWSCHYKICRWMSNVQLVSEIKQRNTML